MKIPIGFVLHTRGDTQYLMKITEKKSPPVGSLFYSGSFWLVVDSYNLGFAWVQLVNTPSELRNKRWRRVA